MTQKTKTEALAIVQKDPWAFALLDPQFRDDREIVMAAVEQEGLMLEHASERLQNDHAVVLAAVRQDGYAFHFASEALHDDEAVVMQMLLSDSKPFSTVSARLRADPLIAITAVKQNPAHIEYLAPELQTHPVLLYIEKHGLSIPLRQWSTIKQSLLDNMTMLQLSGLSGVGAWIESVCTAHIPVESAPLPKMFL